MALGNWCYLPMMMLMAAAVSYLQEVIMTTMFLEHCYKATILQVTPNTAIFLERVAGYYCHEPQNCKYTSYHT